MVVTEGRKSVVYHPARMRSRRDTRMILIRIKLGVMKVYGVSIFAKNDFFATRI